MTRPKKFTFSLRLDPNLRANLEKEGKERGLDTTAYIRGILQKRELLRGLEAETRLGEVKNEREILGEAVELVKKRVPEPSLVLAETMWNMRKPPSPDHEVLWADERKAAELRRKEFSRRRKVAIKEVAKKYELDPRDLRDAISTSNS